MPRGLDTGAYPLAGGGVALDGQREQVILAGPRRPVQRRTLVAAERGHRREQRGDGDLLIGQPQAAERVTALEISPEVPRWARTAGFTDVTATARIWCFATPEDRRSWGWHVGRPHSPVRRRPAVAGVGCGDLRRIAAAWLAWADSDDGWLAIPHGEIVCRAERANPQL